MDMAFAKCLVNWRVQKGLAEKWSFTEKLSHHREESAEVLCNVQHVHLHLLAPRPASLQCIYL